MNRTTIPGACIAHKIITDQCRINRRDHDALDVAIEEVRRFAENNMKQIAVGGDWKFHIVCTIERPAVKKNCTIEHHAPDCDCDGMGGAR